MTTEARPDAVQRQQFYEEFSLATGLRDWLQPNARHLQLKLEVSDLVAGRSGLRILDVGCGAGVMTAYLTRYGRVTGLDFSEAAIAAARGLAPRAEFVAGSLDALPRDARFDLIALFDVLEHIPEEERPAFLADVRELLATDGTLFISTPFPAYTAHRRIEGDDTLQVVDEEIELPQITAEAAELGLQLVRFRAFDVFRGSPEYQVMVFIAERSPGGPPVLVAPRLQRRLRLMRSRHWRRARKLGLAMRLIARGRFREARWMLTGVAPHVRS